MSTEEDSSSGLHVVDYIIIAAFNAISIGIGIFYACHGGKQRTNNEFLMGNRNLPTVPVAISIAVSFFSGIMFIGYPAEIYFYGTEYSVCGLGFIIAVGLNALTFVPLFYELKITSSFEYLEARYRSKSVRLIGTIVTLVNMIAMLGFFIYAPAVALQAVNRIPIWITITVSSMVSVLYTILGGMKAVIYTDVFQSLCIVIGFITIGILGTIEVGNFGKVWELNERDGRINFFNFDPDPTLRSSFWSLVLNGIFRGMYIFGVGQTTIQRIYALPTLAQAKSSMWLNIIVIVIVFILPTIVGLVIYAYYAAIGCDPLRAKYITSQNQLLSYFVRNVLKYPGSSGALFAVLFGGSLSSISSTLNSAAVIVWEDILKKFFEHFTEAKKTIVTKSLVLLFGFLGIGVAFAAQQMSSHVLQIGIAFLGAFGGPMLGIFLLGALFPFANSKGAGIGVSVAIVINIWMTVGSMLYNPSSEILPTSIEGCNATVNASLRNSSKFDDDFNNAFAINNHSDVVFNDTFSSSSTERMSLYSNPLKYLYSISFYLVPYVGMTITIVLGIVISLLTGGYGDSQPNPNLLIPVFDRLCCYLPLSLRRKLRCGIVYELREELKSKEALAMLGGCEGQNN